MTSTALRYWSLDWKQTLAVREEEKKKSSNALVPIPGPIPFPSIRCKCFSIAAESAKRDLCTMACLHPYLVSWDFYCCAYA